MIRLQLNPVYKTLLSENQLVTYAEMMAIDTGSFFELDDQRDVRRIELNQQFFP